MNIRNHKMVWRNHRRRLASSRMELCILVFCTLGLYILEPYIQVLCIQELCILVPCTQDKLVRMPEPEQSMKACKMKIGAANEEQPQRPKPQQAKSVQQTVNIEKQLPWL